MKVLSLDGGGVRGVLQARVLQRLEAKHPFLDKIDRFAGVSIGAVNAAWLATGRPLDTLIDLYRKAGPFIFGKQTRSIAFFAKAALRTQLKAYLGDVRLRDLQRPVLCGAVSLKGPKFFDPFFSPDRDELLVDVVLAATAAVPILPPHKGYVDGGFLANDPSAVALEWVGQDLSAPKCETPWDHGGGDCSLRTVKLLSVGTGEAPSKPAGFLGTLVKAVTVGQRAATELTCSAKLGGLRYHRAQPQIPKAVDLNDADAIPDLVQYANRWDEREALAWIRQQF